MQYTQMSKLARNDLDRVIAYLRETNQNVGKLPAAIQANSPIMEKHIATVLADADFSEADAFTKRVAGYLLAYGDSAVKYARERIADAAADANERPARTSVQCRVSLPDDLVQWWDSMTPVERGDWIAARKEREVE